MANLLTNSYTTHMSLFIIPATFFVALVAIFGIRQAPGIFLGIAAACSVIWLAAAIIHA
jgi:Ca2+/H+ antiporter